MLIVVAIIGIVAAIAIPNLLVALQKGKQKATMGDMKSVGTALEVYAVDNSFVPDSDLPGLIPPAGTSNFFVPFYIPILPLTDAWGTSWIYQHFDLISAQAGQYIITSYGRDKISSPAITVMYQVTELKDFNFDITFSNGLFTLGPIVKK